MMKIILKNNQKFIIPEKIQDNGDETFWRRIGKWISSQKNYLMYREEIYGIQNGNYGHGYTSISIIETEETPGWKYRPGETVFQVTWISDCNGPGHTCSYDHGVVIEIGKIED